jgi:peroxiredoxin
MPCSESRARALAVLAGAGMAAAAALAAGLSPVDAGMTIESASSGSAPAAPQTSYPAAEGEIAEGDVAPGFDLPDINGGRLALADVRGRENVLLVVWATWCPPCIQEFEHLKRLHGAFAGRGLRILAVGVRYQESFDEVRDFARDVQAPFTVLYDEREKVVQNYGVVYIPSNYLIDRAGVIRFAASGLPPDLDARLEALLTEEGAGGGASAPFDPDRSVY